MKKIKRFGVSLEDDLLKELDTLVRRRNFPNRSQAIRFLIRKNVVEKQWQENKNVAGCIVLVYDHHKKDIINSSISLQHKYQDLVLSVQHLHLDHYNCLEIIAVKGRALRLRGLSDKLIALKGIKHGKLVTSASGSGK